MFKSGWLTIYSDTFSTQYIHHHVIHYKWQISGLCHLGFLWRCYDRRRTLIHLKKKNLTFTSRLENQVRWLDEYNCHKVDIFSPVLSTNET